MMTDDERGRPSYERINYSLRPAKAIERHMLCEIFGRLYPFCPVDQYGYVGFGSIYFTDFQLIHRKLGINDLTSIERDEINAERFKLNLPYGCISLRFEESSAVLPGLDWSKKRVVWLDYDSTLGPDELADVSTVISKAQSGSFLALSLNAQPAAEPSEERRKISEAKTGQPFRLPDYRLSVLKERLKDKVPDETDGKDLKIEGLPKVLRRILLNEIDAQLAVRNALLSSADRLVFRQVAHFHYRDGAQMLTLGGVLCAERDRAAFEACRFGELHFCRDSDAAFSIKVPCLTPREMRYLNAFLPTTDASAITRSGIPEADLLRYAEIYRYFPSFTEVVFH